MKEDSAALVPPNEALQNTRTTQEMAMMEDLRVINGILNGKEVPIGQGHMTQS